MLLPLKWHHWYWKKMSLKRNFASLPPLLVTWSPWEFFKVTTDNCDRSVFFHTAALLRATQLDRFQTSQGREMFHLEMWSSSEVRSLTFSPLQKRQRNSGSCGRSRPQRDSTAVRINLGLGLNTGLCVLIRFPNVIQLDCSFYTKE